MGSLKYDCWAPYESPDGFWTFWQWLVPFLVVDFLEVKQE